jgi:hypothetical protein
MNVAIGVLTLVLGGVYIPGIEEPLGEPERPTYEAPTEEFGAPGPGPAYPGWEPGYSRPRPGFPGRAPSPFGRRPSSGAPGITAGPSVVPAPPPVPYGEPTEANRSLTLQEPLVPFAPTDPSAVAERYPWAPPTAGSPPGEGAVEQRPTVGGSSGAYSAPGPSRSVPYIRPRAGRPAYRGTGSYPSYASQQARMPRLDLTQGSPYSASATVSKPFAGYTRARATSPYMELNRTDYGYNVIDPYNQYVRPQLERMSANQQLGREIRGLQHSVQTLGRQTQSLRGVIIPQYYMNYGNYYPGFGR